MRVRLDKQFNSEWLGTIPKPASTFLSSPYVCKFEAKDYVPGEERFTIKDNILYMNVWVSSGVIAADGDCSTILNHFEYIFPDEDVRNHWLNYFASLVQFPNRKIKHCLLLIGKQGVGKSYFKKLLIALLGASNIGLIDSGEWSGPFNAHLLNKHVAVIEELMASGRLEAYNQLKTYLSEPWITANEKHVAQYQARTPYAFLVFSNHRKPILLEGTDRRFHVYNSPVECRSGKYYDGLFGSIKDEVGAFLHYLQKRDLSEFSPDARPPMTDAKAELIKLSVKPSKAALQELIGSEARPFHKDILTLNDIRDELCIVGGLTQRALENTNLIETLLNLGAASLGQKRVGGARLSLWAIRNADRWLGADSDSIKAEYSK